MRAFFHVYLPIGGKMMKALFTLVYFSPQKKTILPQNSTGKVTYVERKKGNDGLLGKQFDLLKNTRKRFFLEKGNEGKFAEIKQQHLHEPLFAKICVFRKRKTQNFEQSAKIAIKHEKCFFSNSKMFFFKGSTVGNILVIAKGLVAVWCLATTEFLIRQMLTSSKQRRSTIVKFFLKVIGKKKTWHWHLRVKNSKRVIFQKYFNTTVGYHW